MKWMKKGDFAILVCIAAAAAAVLFVWHAGDSAVYGEIWQDNELVRQIRLEDGYHETVLLEEGDYHGTIEIDGKRMRFAAADCPDQVFVHTGWIVNAGQTAVCLPGKALIKIKGEEMPSGVDVVAS